MNWYKRQLKIAMPPALNWSSDQLEKIEKMINEGKSFREIARNLGVNFKQIEKLNKKYQWRDTKSDILKKYDLAASLYLLPPGGKGMSAKNIKEQYGITNSTIQKALKRLNLEDKWRGRGEAAKLVDQKGRWNDELREDASEIQKQRFIDNIKLREDASKRQKQRFIDNPDLRKEYSRRMKQRFIDNPDLRKEHSERMLKKWKEWGGFEGRLKLAPNRESAVAILRNFIGAMRNKPNNPMDTSTAVNIHNFYLQIINEHTYPDEVQQGVTV